jgi:hypothetical protein
LIYFVIFICSQISDFVKKLGLSKFSLGAESPKKVASSASTKAASKSPGKRDGTLGSTPNRKKNHLQKDDSEIGFDTESSVLIPDEVGDERPKKTPNKLNKRGKGKNGEVKGGADKEETTIPEKDGNIDETKTVERANKKSKQKKNKKGSELKNGGKSQQQQQQQPPQQKPIPKLLIKAEGGKWFETEEAQSSIEPNVPGEEDETAGVIGRPFRKEEFAKIRKTAEDLLFEDIRAYKACKFLFLDDRKFRSSRFETAMILTMDCSGHCSKH